MKTQVRHKKQVVFGGLMAALLWMNVQPVSAQVEQCIGRQTPFCRAIDTATALTVQADGKLVVAGYNNTGTLLNPVNVFALVRYKKDGSLDPTFGTGGKVTTTIDIFSDKALALAIQKDGKLVAAGYSNYGTLGSPKYGIALVRYNTDGSLDPTFGTGGKVTTAVGSTYDDQALRLAIQRDGKLIVAGNSHKDDQYEFALVRYNADGSLDQTFGGTGVAMAIGHRGR